MSFPTHSHYSRLWAIKVVDAFTSRYTRATEIQLRIWDITMNNLYTFLSFNDPFWNYFRDRVKKTAELADRVGKYYTDVEYYCWEKALAERYAPYAIRERLDKRLKSLRIREWGKTVGASEAEADEAPLLFQYFLSFMGEPGEHV